MGARDVLAGLDTLPKEQRSVLLLVGGGRICPYAEAAQVLGVPLGTVMSRLESGADADAKFSGNWPVLAF